MADWANHPGTKIQALVDVLRHVLSDDQCLPVMDGSDGKPIIPAPRPLLDGESYQRSRKVLVYHDFAMLTGIIVNVLGLHGIQASWINGSIPAGRRNERVQSFKTAASERVLLFTAVGGTGLNLAVADVVIFFVSPTAHSSKPSQP